MWHQRDDQTCRLANLFSHRLSCTLPAPTVLDQVMESEGLLDLLRSTLLPKLQLPDAQALRSTCASLRAAVDSLPEASWTAVARYRHSQLQRKAALSELQLRTCAAYLPD